jgi:hypothetical protein
MTLTSLIHIAMMGAMTIVLWMVQHKFYPAFLSIHPDEFLAHHSRYTKTITIVVAPLMGTELITAVWLFVELYSFVLPPSISLWLVSVNMIALAMIWVMTMFVHVPQHDYLSNGWHEHTIRQLIRTNWVRTISYSSRCVLWAVHLLVIDFS